MSARTSAALPTSVRIRDVFIEQVLPPGVSAGWGAGMSAIVRRRHGQDFAHRADHLGDSSLSACAKSLVRKERLMSGKETPWDGESQLREDEHERRHRPGHSEVDRTH